MIGCDNGLEASARKSGPSRLGERPLARSGGAKGNGRRRRRWARVRGCARSPRTALEVVKSGAEFISALCPSELAELVERRELTGDEPVRELVAGQGAGRRDLSPHAGRARRGPPRPVALRRRAPGAGVVSPSCGPASLSLQRRPIEHRRAPALGLADRTEPRRRGRLLELERGYLGRGIRACGLGAVRARLELALDEAS